MAVAKHAAIIIAQCDTIPATFLTKWQNTIARQVAGIILLPRLGVTPPLFDQPQVHLIAYPCDDVIFQGTIH